MYYNVLCYASVMYPELIVLFPDLSVTLGIDLAIVSKS